MQLGLLQHHVEFRLRNDQVRFDQGESSFQVAGLEQTLRTGVYQVTYFAAVRPHHRETQPRVCPSTAHIACLDVQYICRWRGGHKGLISASRQSQLSGEFFLAMGDYI